jgi:hypothetical protein
MPAYFPDDMHGAVMVKKIGGRYCEFMLDHVKVWTKGYDRDVSSRPIIRVQFVWEKKARKCWDYKIYEEGDYFSSPNPLISHVKRWAQHKIRLM